VFLILLLFVFYLTKIQIIEELKECNLGVLLQEAKEIPLSENIIIFLKVIWDSIINKINKNKLNKLQILPKLENILNNKYKSLLSTYLRGCPCKPEKCKGIKVKFTPIKREKKKIYQYFIIT